MLQGERRRVAAHEASDVERECAEEDDRLLGRHRHPRHLLVGEWAPTPDARRMDIEVVDGAWDQCEQQAEWARERERGEEVRGRAAGVEPSRQHRPPDQEAGDEVAEVLEVEQRRGVPQGCVIGGRNVPRVVGREPERQRDQRVRERSDGAVFSRGSCGGRREPEHDERRAPFGDRDVLEQVGREQVVERQALEWGHEDDKDQPEPAEEAGNPPARRGVAAEHERVGQRQQRNEHDRLCMEAPAVRLHRRYATRTRA